MIPWEILGILSVVVLFILAVVFWIFWTTKHELGGSKIVKVFMLGVVAGGVPVGIGLDLVLNWLFRWDLSQWLLQVIGG